AHVNLVTTNTVCNRVAQGVNSATGTAHLVRRLYVLSVGSFYAAQDPEHPSGEWWPTVSLNSNYQVLGAVLAP
ncbi:MAG TPA: hypothetical protein VGT98_06690, partial [Candidatus Elarobacter sp.]|nr:hypothetical protein [Candidatus Elarobacter sp.]